MYFFKGNIILSQFKMKLVKFEGIEALESLKTEIKTNLFRKVSGGDINNWCLQWNSIINLPQVSNLSWFNTFIGIEFVFFLNKFSDIL